MKGCGGIFVEMRSAYLAARMLLLALVMITGISFSVHAASPGDIFTVAGGIGDNSAATLATFGRQPYGVAVDSSGNLFIADTNNHRIRKVAAGTGIITTVAGNGGYGYSGDNGPASSANLYSPRGVVVDSSGNLFIADSSNHRIRKVAAGTGIITTVAGNGTSGYSGDNSASTAARISGPGGVAVDSAGNLYIADTGNRRIRKVASASGIITTVAGNGIGLYDGTDGNPATLTSINPTGVIVDSSGNLFIADSSNNRIRKVTAATGSMTTVAGRGNGSGFGGDGGFAIFALLSTPMSVSLDSSGNLYIADCYNCRIRKVTAATGIITTVAGNGTGGYSGDGGAATSANLNYPLGVAVDSSGNLLFIDQTQSESRIRKVAATGIITTIAGNLAAFIGDGGVATAARLLGPEGLSADNAGNLYIADSKTNRIRKVDVGSGIITTVAGNGTSAFAGDDGAATSASLQSPRSVTADSAGNLFIADFYNNRVRKVTVATGIITTVAGNGTLGFAGDNGAAISANLKYPSGVAVDSTGNLFIADYYNNRIRRVAAATGIITTVAGNGTAGFSGDNGPATAASLSYPTGVAVDSAGNLFIVDSSSNRVRMVTAATGIITTVAGNGTAGYSGDNGAATSATLNSPLSVFVDSSGSIFIADSVNNRIRKVTASTGIITTVAGNGTADFSGDNGAATSASLYSPGAVTVDGSGNLYISDFLQYRVRKVIKPLATTAAISYSPAGAYNTGAQVTITAAFNDLVAETPVPQIALSGANTLAATNMTKVDNNHYSYTYTVKAGDGSVLVTIPTGSDINRVPLSSTPVSGAFFPIGVSGQSVSFGTAPVIVVGGTGTVSASATSGLAVSYSSMTSNVCTISDSTVTGIIAGTCVIAADQAGGANYFAAQQVTQSFTIVKTVTGITLGGLTATCDGTQKQATVTTIPAGLTYIITYEGSTTPPTNAGNYAVIATIDDIFYQGTAVGTLTIIPTLSVIVGGNGKGVINSIPSGITCSEGTAGTCTYPFVPGTVTLHASPSTISLFGGWNGCTPVTPTSCDVLISGNKSVSAIFTPAAKAMIYATEYDSLNSAYLAAYNSVDSGATINLLETEFIENLQINGKDIILVGGQSADYITRNGQPSILKGVLTVKSGSLRVDRVMLRPKF